MDVAINYTPILVATIAGMMVGSLWYSSALFGKRWMHEMKLSSKDMGSMMGKGMMKNYVIQCIGLFVMAFVLWRVLQMGIIPTTLIALQIAFWLWLGFMATVLLGQVLWEKKSWILYSINATHYLVVVLVMTAVLAW